MPDLFILCEYATLSGGERSMLAVLEGVCRAGFRVAVIGPPEGPLAQALAARGVRLVPFSTVDRAGRRRPQPELRRELTHLVSAHRPCLLDANSLAMGRLSGPVARAMGVPCICHIRDIVKLSRQAIADVNCHDRLLAVSDAVRAYHVAQGLAVEKVHVVYNGIDLGEFRPRAPTGFLHRELGLAPSARLIGTIGQIGMRKGLDVLARAAVPLANRWPEVHFLVIGQRWSEKLEARRFEARLHALAEELGGRMQLLGFRPDVSRILNELTILVHPARQEPLGRVLLEAAASGTPIVATDVGGTREIFPPESGSARLVPHDDPSALAGAIDELLADEACRVRMGEAARRRAVAAFDAYQAAARLIEHYRQLLA